MAMKRLAVKKRSLLHRGCVNVFFDRSFGIVIIKVPKQRYSKRKSQTWCIPTVALIRLFIVLQHDVSKEHSIKDCLEQAPMSH